MWMEAHEGKDVLVNIRKTTVIVSSLEGELFKSYIDRCGVCARREIAYSLLCTKCGNWAQGRQMCKNKESRH